MERRLIEATLEHFGGHRAKTAKALGIGLRTLSGKLRQYGYAPREKSFAKADATEAAESADSERQNLPLAAGQTSAGDGTRQEPVARETTMVRPGRTMTLAPRRPAAAGRDRGIGGRPTAVRGLHGQTPRAGETGKHETKAMLSGLFQSTTIPVLEQVVSFAQARHTVLAGNIANMDTPGYQARDLSVEDFQTRLKAAIAGARPAARPCRPASRASGPPAPLAEVAKTVAVDPAARPGQRGHGNASVRNGQEPDAAQPGLVDHGRPVPPAADGHQREGVSE